VIKDQVEGVMLSKVDVPRPNVNPGRPNYDPLGKKNDAPKPEITPQTISKPQQVEGVKPSQQKQDVPEVPISKPSGAQPSTPAKPSGTIPASPSKPSAPSAPSKPVTSPAGGKVGKG